jgi:hypothetical protein
MVSVIMIIDAASSVTKPNTISFTPPPLSPDHPALEEQSN